MKLSRGNASRIKQQYPTTKLLFLLTTHL